MPCCAAPLAAAQAERSPPPPALDPAIALRDSQAAIGRAVGEHPLLDRQGQPVRLSDYRGKPLLVSFIYTGCFQVCPTTTRSLSVAVEQLTELFGADRFNVVSVGFNQPFDSPPRCGRSPHRCASTHPNWDFLSPTPGTVEALTARLRLPLRRHARRLRPRADGVSCSMPQGRIYAQVYGERLSRDKLGEPLRRLLRDAPLPAGTPLEELVRARAHSVHSVRPADRHYRYNYGLILEIAGGVTFALAMVWFFVVEWRTRRQMRRSARPVAAPLADAPHCRPVMHPLRAIRLHALAGFRRLEQVFDCPFGSGLNPLRHLGALGFLLFWLLAVSGIYLYVVLDTSAEGAYRSIDQLSREQWYLGGVLRSLHRYAADGFILVMVAHLLREGLYGRYSGFRRFSWLTGVPLLLFAFVSAIGGFWLNWDQLGQFSALATAEWLDWLPLFGVAVDAQLPRCGRRQRPAVLAVRVRAHRRAAAAGVRPVVSHPAHQPRATVFPPRRLAIGTAVTLLVLALAAPVMSQAPADLAVVPTALAFDWLLLFVHPLTYCHVGPHSSGLLLAGALLLLFVLARHAAARASTDRRGRRRQLQWLPPLFRRLPLCRRDHGAAPDASVCASWLRSTPTCARVAASASAPARRRRPFAVRPSW